MTSAELAALSIEVHASSRISSVLNQLHFAPCRDVNRVNEEWFTDMDGLREKVGLLDEQPSGSGRSKVRPM